MRTEEGVHVPDINKKFAFAHLLGLDEKGCKMDVDQRRQASTVDGLEKCSLVNVDQEKCSGVNLDRQRSTFIISTGRRRRSTSTAAFFSVDSRQPFSSRPIFKLKKFFLTKDMFL